MTVVTRDAVTPAAFGVPETESQRGTKTPATAAVDLVREFPRKRKETGACAPRPLLDRDSGEGARPMTMDAEFCSRVAERFGGFSDARSTDAFPDGRPGAVFDELVTALGAPRARLLAVGRADGRSLLRVSPAYGAVTGTDLSASMLECAARYRAEAGRAGRTSRSSCAMPPIRGCPMGPPMWSLPAAVR